MPAVHNTSDCMLNHDITISVLALNLIYISKCAFCFDNHKEDRAYISSSEPFDQCLGGNFPLIDVLDFSHEYTLTIPTSYDKLDIDSLDLHGDFHYNHHLDVT